MRFEEKPSDALLVGDLDDAVYLFRDLDGDGIASGRAERTIFFDASNASGLANPVGSPYSAFQASGGEVYVSDGGSDAVYRLEDVNRDGDAQDAGEARVWFSAANAEGLTLPTPNSVHEGGDGAIYVVNAGTGSAPTDAIYRTEDLNGDGDANDAGESRIWLDLQTVAPTSSAFDLTFRGDVAFLSDTIGGEPDAIFRIEDVNGDGSIDAAAGEVSTYISLAESFGSSPNLTHATAADGSIYVFSFGPGNSPTGVHGVHRLTDLDGSGAIDSAAEVVEVWNASAMPEGFDTLLGFNIEVADDGTVALSISGGNVALLTDHNGDGDFFDANETTVFASESYDATLGRPRFVEFYDDPRSVLSGGDSGDVITGTRSSDLILGNSGNDILSGIGGDDELYGGAGNDMLTVGRGTNGLYGGDGNDKMFGSFGNDILDGGAGNDLLSGGSGNDVMVSGAGNDTLFSGFGNDVLVWEELFATGETDRILDFSRGDQIDLSALGDDIRVEASGRPAFGTLEVSEGDATDPQLTIDVRGSTFGKWSPDMFGTGDDAVVKIVSGAEVEIAGIA